MQCDVCERDLSSRRKALCVNCARASLYSSRISQASSLLNREKSHAHVEAIVRPGNDGVLAALPEDADWDVISAGIQSHSLERMKAEMVLAEQKIRSIEENARELRGRMESHKNSIEEQKAANKRRAKEIVDEKQHLIDQKGRAYEGIHSTVKKARHRLEKVHKRTAEAREYLCREAASLSGLRKVRREDGRADYQLSGILVPDPRDLNGINKQTSGETMETPNGDKAIAESHEVVSAALDNVSHLLGIVCHYLSVRLPLEIILPHNDFPHAAILPRDSSYRSSNVRYPGSLSSQASSPMTSRILQKNELSRPRLLQIDRPFPQLQKDDSKTALLFLEGITLLAYNVAWLCRSQGVDSIKSFSDICAIGQNLYQLLYGKDGKTNNRPPLNRNISAATTKTERSNNPTDDATIRFGTYSHSSTRHSLAGHEGFTLFSHEQWPVTIHRLTDQLKAYLRNESARAEWHYVDDTEWDEVLESDRPVLVGGARRQPDGVGMDMSVLSVKPSDGTDEAEVPFRERGARGWMKVRGREGEG